MCPPQDIAPLRARLGDRLLFNGMINKKPRRAGRRRVPQPRPVPRSGRQDRQALVGPARPRPRPARGRPVAARGLRRACKAGVRIVMVHVGDPDAWWTHTYQDTAKFGTKPDQYVGRSCARSSCSPTSRGSAPTWAATPSTRTTSKRMLEKHPNLYFDTSATKWQVREVSPRRDAIRSLICRHPTRFLFGSDLVTRHGLTREHYVSRYWCQRTLWESDLGGPQPDRRPGLHPRRGRAADADLARARPAGGRAAPACTWRSYAASVELAG